MIFPDTNKLKDWWKSLQLRSFGLLSSGSAFIASQYFTVRGLRTLNGKMVQHKLSQFYAKHRTKTVLQFLRRLAIIISWMSPITLIALA